MKQWHSATMGAHPSDLLSMQRSHPFANWTDRLFADFPTRVGEGDIIHKELDGIGEVRSLRQAAL